MGRKPKAPSDRVAHWKVALTEAEYARCVEAAEREGRTFAMWARWHLKQAAGIAPAGTADPAKPAATKKGKP